MVSLRPNGLCVVVSLLVLSTALVLVLPVISGPTLAERITATRPELPVLFMSGYEAGALPAGAPPPLAKPFSSRDLADAVGALFRRAG